MPAKTTFLSATKLAALKKTNNIRPTGRTFACDQRSAALPQTWSQTKGLGGHSGRRPLEQSRGERTLPVVEQHRTAGKPLGFSKEIRIAAGSIHSNRQSVGHRGELEFYRPYVWRLEPRTEKWSALIPRT